MGSVADQEQPQFRGLDDKQRRAELLRQVIEAAVKAAAFDLRLPYELEKLERLGTRGLADALDGDGYQALGLLFPQRVERCVYEDATFCALENHHEARYAVAEAVKELE